MSATQLSSVVTVFVASGAFQMSHSSKRLLYVLHSNVQSPAEEFAFKKPKTKFAIVLSIYFFFYLNGSIIHLMAKLETIMSV